MKDKEECNSMRLLRKKWTYEKGPESKVWKKVFDSTWKKIATNLNNKWNFISEKLRIKICERLFQVTKWS